MSSITEWLRGKFEHPQTREENELARIGEAYKLGQALIEQRSEPVRKAEKGWTNPTKAAYFAEKLDEANQGSRYTFQVTTKANCYESALLCIQKGEPVRQYSD